MCTPATLAFAEELNFSCAATWRTGAAPRKRWPQTRVGSRTRGDLPFAKSRSESQVPTLEDRQVPPVNRVELLLCSAAEHLVDGDPLPELRDRRNSLAHEHVGAC
jgi:hypothetical protein